MPVLPDVVGSHSTAPRCRGRRLIAVGAAVAAITALAGCSQFDSALGQRQAVVSFANNATLAQRMAVRSACAKTPNVTAAPVPGNLKTAYQLPQVTFTITKASDADVAELQTCLSKYPTVAGVTLQDASDEGN
jgi:hypothetical protein